MIAVRAVPRSYGLGLLACLIAGISIGFDVEFVGRITGTEMILLLLLPAAWVLRAIPPLAWPIRSLAGLSLVWFAAQYVSDLVNGSDLDNMLRGAARAWITAVLILGFFTLTADRVRNVHALYAAMTAGLLISPYLNPPLLLEADIWKFGYGNGITMMVIGATTVLWAMRQRFSALALCLAIGLFNLWLGYRSMAGIVFMTGLLLGLTMLLGATARITSTPRVAIAAFVICIGGAGIIELYAEAARGGLLGANAQEKFLQQVDERGVLLSGRSEWPIALEAVRERPLLGHGSWAANEHYAILYWEMSGFSIDHMPEDFPDLIPTHSHLMGAWVEGGILAALFWFYAMFLLVKAIVVTVRNSAVADPVIVFTLMNFAWAVLFSPYGLTNRVLSCFAIVVAATVLRLDKGTAVTSGRADGR